MARHLKRRRQSAVMVAGAAAGLTTALAFGHATNATAATIPANDIVIGVGGAGDTTGARVPAKFQGQLVANNHAYAPVPYPALLPVDPSVDEGVPVLRAVVDDAVATDKTVLIVGYSQGSLVAEKYKRSLVEDGSPNVDKIQFLFLASPFVPNGGIYSRFPNMAIPGFVSTGTATPSPYDELFVTLEYDLVGDFPAYANPLSLANAVVGFRYVHGDQGPDNVDLANDRQSVLITERTDEGGQDTYVLIRAEHLPLLQPVRDVSAALQTTAFTEPVLVAVEPTLRLVIDMGYTDRDYQDADKPTRFSLFTPPERIAETLAALPDAIEEGADNFVNELPSAPSPSVDKPAEPRQQQENRELPAEPDKQAEQDEQNEAKAEKPKVEKPKIRKPAERPNPLKNLVSRTLNNLKPKPKPKPHQEEDHDKPDAPAEKHSEKDAA